MNIYRNTKHRFLLWVAAVALAAGPVRAGWVREIEITTEPEENEQRDYTVRIRPETSHNCERIVFDCVLHQEFPWEETKGVTSTKRHEPVLFTYTRRNVKLVNDLDTFISFHVPVGLKLLQETYGPHVFNARYPVIVDRMKISGVAGDKTVWSVELKVPGKHDVTAATAQAEPETAGSEPANVKLP
jgi:hypothetical protein